jgi:NitT/TauT family transport system substrate-binding protein
MKELASGELDIDSMFAPMVITRLEAGDPIVVLAGVHIGCMELYGTERVRPIRDLKGKTVAVPELGGVQYLSSPAC